jgi:hypothetical protein
MGRRMRVIGMLLGLLFHDILTDRVGHQRFHILFYRDVGDSDLNF